MSRPTEDLCETLRVRVSGEQMKMLRDESNMTGLSLSEVVRGKLIQQEWNVGLFDGIAEEIGTDVGHLAKIFRFLLDKELIYRDEEGKFRYQNKVIEEDYISVDEVIDALEITDKKKDEMKRRVIESLYDMDKGTEDWA
ncbi:MAG: hypothetical protein LIR46_07675 [Bacteroidota bacterium]|nr:hypothetical protein [Bacteroidota bacterium]